MNYNEYMINEKLALMHTAYVGQVLSASGDTARVQPLTYSVKLDGTRVQQPAVTARVPANVKLKQAGFKARTITYVTGVSGGESDVSTTTASDTVIVPDESNTPEYGVFIPDTLKAGDIVFCGVSERDISSDVLSGKTTAPTRRHDLNDSVVLAVFNEVSG